MKTLFQTLVIMLSITCFSQNDNLYILINKESVIDTTTIKNDTIIIQSFVIDYNDRPLKSGAYSYEIDKNNKLIKKFAISGAGRRSSFSFTYLNINNDNPPVLINKDSIANKISYKEIMEAKDFSNVASAVLFFKTIYIINEDEDYEGYHIAKRIDIRIPNNGRPLPDRIKNFIFGKQD